MKKRVIWSLSAAMIAGTVLLLFPLLRSFHLDSALLAGVIGAFVAGRRGATATARDSEVGLITAVIYTAGLPLLARDLIAGCFSAHGLAFWLFIPVFSIFFGFSAGRALRYFLGNKGRWITMILLVVITIGGLLIPFFLFPQLYFFNHVFGYWPGAIYDESVVITGRLPLYRTITLAWIALFWLVPHLSTSDRVIKGIFGLILLSLVINYAMLANNGLISPRSHIQQTLGETHHTKHFTLYYSKEYYDKQEITFLADLHEFHFLELTDTLDVSWPEGKRVESYLYGHEWQMQKLTGAKGVSYVPVWQQTPQVHIRKSAIENTLRHELVHVIARSFGNRLLNASWNIGLVEGLAVALSPASSRQLSADQLVVSNDACYSVDEIKNLFSLTGFYRESGPVAYAVSGSFVAALIRDYPVDYFKEAYRHSSLNSGYKDVLEDAVDNWHEKFAGVQVTDTEKERAIAIFDEPSLFDARCPRRLTVAQLHRDGSRHALTLGDTLRAVDHLEASLRAESGQVGGWMQWMRLKLETGQIAEIKREKHRMPEHPLITIRLADAYVADGRHREAAEKRLRALDKKQELPENAQTAWSMRADMERWKKRVRIQYAPSVYSDEMTQLLLETDDVSLVLIYLSEVFRRHPLPKWKTGGREAELIATLTHKVINAPIRKPFFETYRNLIYHSVQVLPDEDFIRLWFDKGVPRCPAGMFNTPDCSTYSSFCDQPWRPVQQQRLEEALRFGWFYSTCSAFSAGS